MPDPSDAELISAARDIVFGARKTGKLEHYTKGLIRELIEQKFKAASGSLKPRKTVINEAIVGAMADEDGEQDEQQVEETAEEAPAPVKTEGKKTFKGKKSAAKEQSEDDDKEDDQPAASDEKMTSPNASPKSKKPQAPSSKTKLATSTSKAKRADKNTDNFLSMIGLAPGSKGADENAAAMLVEGLTGGGPKRVVDMKSDSEFSVLEDAPPPKKKSRKSKDKSEEKSKKGTKRSSKAAESSGAASGSDMSGMGEDEAPRKAQKSTKKKREPKAEKVEDKDEDMVKRLKSFVVACGVRKMWVKEFEGLSSAPQRIGHLKKILAELGMTGRLSLEKAKEIREKRDFAKEIEDVKEFDAKINGPRASRSSKAKAKAVSSASEEADEVEEPEPSTRPKKKSNTSILAFLDDQSSD